MIVKIWLAGSGVNTGRAATSGDEAFSFGEVVAFFSEAECVRRDAAGLAERCDAVVVVVSEERGQVSVFHNRGRQLVTSEKELGALLESLLKRPTALSWTGRARELLTSNLKLKVAAVGLAAVTFATGVSVGGGLGVLLLTLCLFDG